MARRIDFSDPQSSQNPPGVSVSAGDQTPGFGVKFNKAKDDEPGSWEAGYDYRETDADTVVGGFNESDFLGAQTNSRGHRFTLRYQLAKNLYWKMTYYLLEDTRTTDDLVWKF